MSTWIINGKRYNEEEYEEYKKQELKEWEVTQAEIHRRISAVGEAYTACEKFMEEHPRYPYGLKDDAQQREFKIYQQLRWNLGAANRAPRCEKVREDGTRCGSPQMKGYRYCYAHERMLQTRSPKLELPAPEDANGIQMAIRRVQKALVDDEISEKKAGLLLYSLQMASSNLKHTSFTDSKKEVVTEMVVSPTSPGAPTSRNQTLPLIHTDDTDRKPAVGAQQSTINQGRGQSLPRLNADGRGSEKKLPRSGEVPRSPALGTEDNLPQMNAGQADLR